MMSFGDVIMSGDVMLKWFVLYCKVDENKCALSGSNEKTDIQ